MRKKDYKGRCEKRSLEKFTTICRTYDPIQYVLANILDRELIELAKLRARDLEINYSHWESPSKTWTCAGENITASGSNIGAHFRNFNNEPDHRVNMLLGQYKYFGYAMYHP